MPKKLQSNDNDLMEIFEHYAELRRERNEYEDTIHKLECESFCPPETLSRILVKFF